LWEGRWSPGINSKDENTKLSLGVLLIDFQSVLDKANDYKEDMSQFLRDIIRIPSESWEEREIVLKHLLKS
jgi:hypothetical protein